MAPRTPRPQESTRLLVAVSEEWEQVLDDLATGRIFPRLSLDHRQEMALILLLHWRSRGAKPGDRAVIRAFRSARARLRRAAARTRRLLPIEGDDLEADSANDDKDSREKALAALRHLATWPLGTRRFFLAVALDEEAPVAAARRHMGGGWSARQARGLWDSLRARLAKTLS